MRALHCKSRLDERDRLRVATRFCDAADVVPKWYAFQNIPN